MTKTRRIGMDRRNATLCLYANIWASVGGAAEVAPADSTESIWSVNETLTYCMGALIAAEVVSGCVTIFDVCENNTETNAVIDPVRLAVVVVERLGVSWESARVFV